MNIYYITTSSAGHFDSLKVVKEEIKPEEIKNYSHNIYFLNKKEAEDFLDEMKKHIKKMYPKAKDWYN